VRSAGTRGRTRRSPIVDGAARSPERRRSVRLGVSSQRSSLHALARVGAPPGLEAGQRSSCR